ncbi:MAG: hypothetical protein ICV64_02510 [Thermoleophilia bacterium]|nr:hypothetical protein [Thermoleophilia bacterium]
MTPIPAHGRLGRDLRRPRTRIGGVIAPLVAALLAGAPTPAAPCQAALPHGPRVPAPIVFTTSCGAFRLAPSGRVDRLPKGWLAAHSGGTSRPYGADLQLRRNRGGRIVLLRRGRIVWRSRAVYRNDAGDVAFGPGAFAFAAYHRGVFVTDLRGPERLVVRGRGRYPHAFLASGRLLVTGGPAILVVSPDRRVERTYAYSRRAGHTFDAAGETFYFVTPDGRLAVLSDTGVRLGRPLGFAGTLMSAPAGRLLFEGTRSLMLTTRDGRLVARARWPRSRLGVLDSGVAVAADGNRLAFRLSDARPGATSGTAVLYVVAAEETRARAVYRHRLGPVGCGVGANMNWHGRHLLYTSADGQVAVIDAATGRRTDLGRLARSLPRRSAGERPFAAWVADVGGGRAQRRSGR